MFLPGRREVIGVYSSLLNTNSRLILSIEAKKIMLKQRTIKTIVKTVGIGLHSGRKVELTLRPAPANTGIVFARIDLPEPVDIPASALAIGDTRLASVLQKDAGPIQTLGIAADAVRRDKKLN